MSGGPDIFPFNLPPGGPFLIFFVLAAIVTLVGTAAARAVWAKRVLDRGLVGEAPAPTLWAQPAAVGYRSPMTTPLPADPRPLAIGWIPRGDELYALAYLRRGVAGVANLLTTSAIGERLLVEVETGWTVDWNVDPSSRFVASLKDRLRNIEAEVLDASTAMVHAERVALANEPDLQRMLKDAGLLRSPDRVGAYVGFGLAPVLLFELGGLLRCTMLSSMGLPYGNLGVAMLAFGGVGLWAALTGRYASHLAASYVAWIQDATQAVATDVVHRRRSEPADVTLAAAVFGSDLLEDSLVGAVPLFAGERDLDVSMHADGGVGIGSNAWWMKRLAAPRSSSSCGGGGGCGGGCGGGGCGGGGCS